MTENSGMTRFISELPDVLDTKEVAAFLNMCPAKARALIKYEMKHKKIGATYRVSKACFLLWLEKDVD